ncbi:hypothetical protein ACOJCM_10100 [Billgrantia sp. LNSP4103-1]|uniref:hypothetical protein n=1 Tax=Billgrantia sp. LNSP4103-1 TaxID=3410266 RepID=UPI00403F6F6E
MNENRPRRFDRILESLSYYRKQVIVSVAVAIIMVMIGYAFTEAREYFETRPLTVELDPNAAGETSIMPIFQIQIRPALSRHCARPGWLAWLGETFFGQNCMRISFKPHQLERMITRRLPYKQTASPMQQLNLFIDHHEGCLTMRRSGQKIIIEEPLQSTLMKEEERLVCP